MIINMQNYSYTCSSHNSNFKCIDSTINCIHFEAIHYAINLDVVSISMVFSDFDYIFLLMYY